MLWVAMREGENDVSWLLSLSLTALDLHGMILVNTSRPCSVIADGECLSGLHVTSISTVMILRQRCVEKLGTGSAYSS